jgi:hypothetical protein
VLALLAEQGQPDGVDRLDELLVGLATGLDVQLEMARLRQLEAGDVDQVVGDAVGPQ